MKLLELLKTLTLHPKNAEELKGLILQLAVQGKLTANWRKKHPDVEPAAVLLEKIKKEKARLVKEKINRKEKSRSKITSEEKVFDLPNSWNWTRLGDYIHNLGQKLPDNAFEYIDVGAIDNKKGLITENLTVITPTDAPSRARKIVDRGCVIYSTVRPYLLNIAVVDREFENEAIASTAFAILKPLANCSEYYLYQLLRSFYFIDYVESCMKGVAYPAINDANLLNAVIPIPPLEEQKAIVEVVNQLFTEVEQLEALTKERIQLKEYFAVSALQRLSTGDTAAEWQFLQLHFQTFFTEKSSVKKLREAVLQLAVQGKLTTTWRTKNPDAEPATELLKRINAEKNKLVKEKKIKKEKPLPAISADEIPYELPEGWSWCRFQECATIASNLVKVDDYLEMPHIAPDVIQKNTGLLLDYSTIREDGVTSAKHLFKSGQIIYSKIRPNLNKLVKVDFEGLCSADMYPIDSHVNIDYLFRFMLSSAFLKQSVKTDTRVAMPKINQIELNKIIVSIPPLEEQKAIVEKVTSLMALCDQLEKQITQNDTQVQDLMRSCLREVLGG